MLLMFQDLRIVTTVAVVIGLFVIFWTQLRVCGLYKRTVQGSRLSRPYDFSNVDSFGKQVASVREFGLKSLHLWLPQQWFSVSVSKNYTRIVL